MGAGYTRANREAKAAALKGLTQESLRAMFEYDPESGIVTQFGIKSRVVAMPKNRTRYARITLGGVRTVLHRAIWCWMTGAWPEKQIDHINRNRHDNRWCNLRECEPWQNHANKERARGVLPFIGVQADRNKFTAKIQHQGKTIHIGTFKTPEDAAKARDARALVLKGDFAVLNFPELRNRA